jgi:hypothetical protein
VILVASQQAAWVCVGSGPFARAKLYRAKWLIAFGDDAGEPSLFRVVVECMNDWLALDSQDGFAISAP